MAALFLIIISIFYLGCNKYSDNYKIESYHSNVNKAELAITQNEYLKSEQYYENAFSYKSPFATDYYNYFLVTIELENQKKIYNAVRYLIKNKGATLGFFIDNDSFPELFDLISEKDLRKNYHSWNNYFQKNYDFKKNQLIKKFLIKDQKLRHGNNHYINNLDSILFFDSLFYYKFKEFCQSEEGFPDEFQIGVWMDEDSKKQRSFYAPLEILITHFYGGGGRYHNERNYDLSNCLRDKIHQGKFPPENYTIFSFWKSNFFYTDPGIVPGDYNIIKINDSMFYQNIDDIDSLNIIRAEIFLEPIQDSNVKGLFQIHNKKFILNPKYYIGYNNVSEQTKNIVIKNLNLTPFE